MTIENPQLTDPNVRKFIADVMRGNLRGNVSAVKSWHKHKENGEYPLSIAWEGDNVVFTSSQGLTFDIGSENETFEPHVWRYGPPDDCSVTPLAKSIYADIQAGILTHVINGKELPYTIPRKLARNLFGRRGHTTAVGRNGVAQAWDYDEKYTFLTPEQVAPYYAESRVAEQEILALLDGAAIGTYVHKVSRLPSRVFVDETRDVLITNAEKNNCIVTHPKVEHDGVFTFSDGTNKYTFYPTKPTLMPRIDEAVEWLREEYWCGGNPGKGHVGMALDNKENLPVFRDRFAFDESDYPVDTITSILQGKDKITLFLWWGLMTEEYPIPHRVKQEYPVISSELTPPPFKLPANVGQLKEFIAAPDTWGKPKKKVTTKSETPKSTERRIDMKQPEYTIEDDTLVVKFPLSAPTPSVSGKTLVVASTHGGIRTNALVDGKPVTVNFNAYIAK